MQGASKQKIEPGPGQPGTLQKKGPSVALRWLTALILMPVVLLFVWFGGWAAFLATALVVVLGTLELHSMWLHAGYRPVLWLSLALSFLFLFAAMFPAWRLAILETGLAAFLPLSFVWLFFRKNLDGAVIDWALTLAFSVYLGFSMSFFLLLRGYEPGTLFPASGGWLTLPPSVWWLLVTLLGVWGFDGAAFFAGRSFGRHKLAPHISPAKTWEGAVGGFALSIFATLVLTVVPLGLPWYLAVVLGILLGVAATLGDLAESLIKRQVRVKDSGQIMPGHGGMLDRIDSLMFAVMVVYFFAHYVAH